MGSLTQYSVPYEAKSVFENGILRNPLQKGLPSELRSLAKLVRFEGSHSPTVPINWRFAESISALKAFEATMLNLLVSLKYNVEPSEDHATLFLMSPVVSKFIKNGRPTVVDMFSPDMERLFPNRDVNGFLGGLHRTLITNIYKTKEGRFYHTHGSLNPDITLAALGLPLQGKPDDTHESVVKAFQSKVSQFDATELDELISNQRKQAGTIAMTADEYFASEQGQANAHAGLYEITKLGSQPASWWPANESFPPSPKRPLAGLKVVDLSRFIAGPTVSRTLAEMGASVMHITSPSVADLSILHQDLNWGKWSASLNLKDEGDKEKLRALIREADVVVDAYRPGAIERLGFGRQAICDLVEDRERGIVHVRVNCYGWHGPLKHRPGWQPISDAFCGVSRAYAKAMGHDDAEAVTTALPNSDFCTGVAGTAGTLEALIKRARYGGSYGVDTALNYYSQWLIRSCGSYGDDVWQEVWQRHGSPTFRHYHDISYQLPVIMKSIIKQDSRVLLNRDFYTPMEAKHLGTTFIRPKPVAQFASGVELGYHVGTRGDGIDEPVWPDDLTIEVVKGRTHSDGSNEPLELDGLTGLSQVGIKDRAPSHVQPLFT
ncbi:CoA-transferase family III [Xylaria intraflava]|nr:CoA-transferase family III [Xylaria intraflava]